jgi:hypothetical protein
VLGARGAEALLRAAMLHGYRHRPSVTPNKQA